MRVEVKYNTGEILMNYPKRPSGVSKKTTYGLLIIGREYLVMGMIIMNGCLHYIVDYVGVVSTCPFQLFEITDNAIPSTWFFKANTIDNPDFTYNEAIWGYSELVFDDEHLDKLLDVDEAALRLYFRRKIELEKELEDKD